MAASAYIRTLAQIAAVAAVCLSPPALPAESPEPMQPFEANYSVRYGILRGTMTLQLHRHDEGYLYETSLSPRGLVSWLRDGTISERTALQITNASVTPLDYNSTDTIARPVRNTSYHFNQADGRVTGQYKTHLIDVPMKPGGHNRISAQVAIMMALKSGTLLSGLAIFDRGRWKDYEFEIVGGQSVDTPAGRFDTVEIRYASADNVKSWSLYCGVALNYLPVMIVYREDGKTKSRALLSDYQIHDSN